jgi:hypothetical protein
MSSGFRPLEDERAIVTELARMVHVAKAHKRQRKVIVAAKEGEQGVRATTDDAVTQGAAMRRRRRSPKQSGSVWITFKGAFSAKSLYESSPGGQERIAHFRAELTNKKQEKALTVAEEYLKSARQQAAEAGLIESEGPTPEGLEYLREQAAAAAQMTEVPPVGARLTQLVSTSTPQGHPIVHAVPPQKLDPLQRDRLVLDVVRERQLRYAFSEVPSDLPNVEEAAWLRQERNSFVTQLPLEPVPQAMDGGVSEDVYPARCIVRIKAGAPKAKKTTILSNKKSVASFLASMQQFLRKDVSGLMRRAPEENIAAAPLSATTSSTSTKPSASAPQKPTDKRRR